MLLTTWRTPRTTLAALSADVDRLLKDVAIPSPGAWTGYGACPAADVVETEAAFLVKLDMPGHDPASIQLEVENDVLTVRGERRPPDPGKGETVHRSERLHGTTFRSFRLPRSVDSGKVEARYEHGVLTVTLPKREEAKPRSIQVEVR